MYVFYPADELLRIYENPIRQSVSLSDNHAAAVNNGYQEEANQQQYYQPQQQQRIVVASDDVRKRKKERRRETGQTASRRRTVRNGGGNVDKKEGRRSEEQHAGTMQNNRASGSEEAANHPLKDVTQPSLNEPLKQHNGVTLKLVQTGKCVSSHINVNVYSIFVSDNYVNSSNSRVIFFPFIILLRLFISLKFLDLNIKEDINRDLLQVITRVQSQFFFFLYTRYISFKILAISAPKILFIFVKVADDGNYPCI